MTITQIPHERVRTRDTESGRFVKSQESIQNKFIRQVDKHGPPHPYDAHLGRCWLWTGAVFHKGKKQQRGRLGNEPASRIAYELFNGTIGRSWVCHSCDNGMCVNPDHLWLGTAADNWKDCVTKGRNRNAAGDSHYLRRHPELAPRGEKHGASKLTDESVGVIRLSTKQTSELAAEFRVSKSLIKMVRNGKRWRHV